MKYLAAFFLLLANPGLAGQSYVTVEPLKEVTLAAGKKVEANIVFRVLEGFHIQANPPSRQNLVPTTLTLVGEPGVVSGKPVYPVGKPFHMLGSDSEILAYAGTATIKVPLSLESKVKKGKAQLKGNIRYQACNKTNCFFSQTVPFNIPIKIQ